MMSSSAATDSSYKYSMMLQAQHDVCGIFTAVRRVAFG